MEELQEIISYWVAHKEPLKYAISVLVGGGVVWKVLPWGYSQYTRIYSFDRAMNALNKQNRVLAKRSGAYVNRPTLEAALDKMISGRYRVCAISGPAGSGKTRFALNIIKRNRPLSKYYYVYINKSNADYFDSDEFKSLNSIQGNRNYVFIVDYVYENKERINSLINLTEQTKRHKFILIERDYNGLRFPNDFEISMKDHKMNSDALCKIFLNTLPVRSRKSLKTQEEARNLIELIYGQIDQDDVRPVFAELSAQIYSDDLNSGNRLLKSINNNSDLIKLYWNYKFDQRRIQDKCLNDKIAIDEAFMANLDIMMRSLLLIAAVTKKDIEVKFEGLRIKFTLGGEMDVTKLIRTYCEENFLESMERLPLENVREICGVVLKDSIIVNKNRRENKFIITSQLDIISEWLMSDSLANGSDYWISDLKLFLRKSFSSDLCRFMARGALDFSELIQYFENSFSDKVDSNEYLAYIHYSLQRLYEMNDTARIDIKLMELNKFIQNTQVSSPDTFRIIRHNSWKILKEIYGKNLEKKDLTEKIIKIFRGEMNE